MLAATLVCSQNYCYNYITSKNGLLNNEVNTIIQDRKGYLWIGTNGGLSKYDGISFTNYTTENGLSNNSISSLIEDLNGNIWIGNSKTGDIDLFDGKKFKKYSPGNSESDGLNSFYIDRNGTLWACMHSGLYKFNKHIFTKNFFDGNQVRAVIEDNNGTYWIACFNGFYSYNKKIVFKHPEIKYCTPALAKDKLGNLWIGSNDGLYCYSGKSFKHYDFKNPQENLILKIVCDKNGKMWFNNDAFGLVSYANKEFTIINNDLPHINAICVDNEGNKWFGTFNGVVKEVLKPINSLNFKIINEQTPSAFFFKQNDSIKWMYYGDRVCKIENENYKNVLIDGLRKNDRITVMNKNPFTNEIYLGTFLGDVFILKKENFKIFNSKNTFNTNTVFSIYFDHIGNIWVGKRCNIIKYDGKKFVTYYFSKDTLDCYPGFNIAEDKFGNIWFATEDGLVKYFNEKYIKYKKSSGLSTDYIRSLVIDNHGKLWIGSQGGGLFCFDGKHFKNFTIKNGLKSNYIKALFYDSIPNVLWVGTSNGPNKINLDNQSNITEIKKFGTSQGFAAEDVKYNMICKIDSNQLLIGGNKNQFYVYNYKQDTKNKISPRIIIQSIKLFYENPNWADYTTEKIHGFDLPKNPVFPYNQNHITFQFVGLSYPAAEDVTYQWMLVGFDTKWSPITNKREVTYSNLPPGKYTFMVKACNADGFWNQKATSYFFEITPPYWKTWWFIVGLSFIVISGIVFFVRYKINNVRKKEQQKTELIKQVSEVELKALRAQMNPHFVFNSLNTIQSFIANKNYQSAAYYLGSFSTLLRMILQNSFKSFISLEQELKFLKLYTDLEAMRFDNKFKVLINVNKKLQNLDIQVPPMIIQPIVENAFKHGLMHRTKGGVLHIDFDCSPDNTYLTCLVIDNGIGRKKSQELESWKPKDYQSKGIEITESRIRMLNLNQIENFYSITVIDLYNDYNESAGTKVEIKFPLN